MRILIDLGELLDKKIETLSSMTDGDLQAMLTLTERAYVHALIEISLREAPDLGVSGETIRLRCD
jgi:hypothetical protein